MLTGILESYSKKHFWPEIGKTSEKGKTIERW
jgi:hypothetical protein